MDAQRTSEALTRAFEAGGVSELFDALVATLCEAGRLAEVFDALQMKSRMELGLPLLGQIDLLALDERTKSALDNAFRTACRTTGELFLEQGDIPGAWPYFHKIAEFGPVADAIEKWALDADADTPVDVLIQIAFAQGAHPVRGFELLVEHRGTCDAISMLEQRFPFGPQAKAQCVAALLRHFYGEVKHGLLRELGDDRSDDDENATVPQLLDRHGDRLTGHCVVDDSHLQALLRFSIGLSDPEQLKLANELAEYGARLSPSYAHRESSPFQDFYRDYRILLRALAGIDVDAGVEHFRAKTQLEGATPFASEVFVYLLSRVDRSDDAIAAFCDKLGGAQQLTISPSLYDLCRAAGDGAALRQSATERNSPIEFAAGLLDGAASKPTEES